MTYHVYVIQHTVSGDVYIGKTSDVRKRLFSHNTQRNRSTIRKSGEWKLIYVESYRSLIDATQRELKLIHHGSSKRALYQRIAHCFIESKSEAG